MGSPLPISLRPTPLSERFKDGIPNVPLTFSGVHATPRVNVHMARCMTIPPYACMNAPPCRHNGICLLLRTAVLPRWSERTVRGWTLCTPPLPSGSRFGSPKDSIETMDQEKVSRGRASARPSAVSDTDRSTMGQAPSERSAHHFTRPLGTATMFRAVASLEYLALTRGT